MKVFLWTFAIGWELLSFILAAQYVTMRGCYAAEIECPPLRLSDYVVMILPALPLFVWVAFWRPPRINHKTQASK